ncbi:MAG TPA: hypothetical protein VIL74_11325 [Pyrinomonadaceae bacterium]|jgi:hypothetical protein
MGRYYTAKFADGTERTVASFSTNRARLFYEITRIVERYVASPSGVEDDAGLDEHTLDAERFVEFFERFWQIGWLADGRDSFLAGWASFAAGIVENITLQPVTWIDRRGNAIQVRRYELSESDLEEELLRREKAGEIEVRHSEINGTDITV